MLAAFQEKEGKKRDNFQNYYMKQQQGIILVSGRMLQELVWMVLWSLLLFDTATDCPNYVQQ